MTSKKGEFTKKKGGALVKRNRNRMEGKRRFCGGKSSGQPNLLAA